MRSGRLRVQVPGHACDLGCIHHATYRPPPRKPRRANATNKRHTLTLPCHSTTTQNKKRSHASPRRTLPITYIWHIELSHLHHHNIAIWPTQFTTLFRHPSHHTQCNLQINTTPVIVLRTLERPPIAQATPCSSISPSTYIPNSHNIHPKQTTLHTTHKMPTA